MRSTQPPWFVRIMVRYCAVVYPPHPSLAMKTGCCQATVRALFRRVIQLWKQFTDGLWCPVVGANWGKLRPSPETASGGKSAAVRSSWERLKPWP